MNGPLLMILLACRTPGPTTDAEADDHRPPALIDPDGIGEPPLRPIPTYDCPPPPDDAITFTIGTMQADQIFYHYFGPVDNDEFQGWHMAISGISYVRDEYCHNILHRQEQFNDIKAGEQPGEYTVELLFSLPGDSVEDWLGEFPMNDGHLWSHLPAHVAKIGWNDTDHYQWVNTLPNGWTGSTLCIGTVSPDYVHLTFLWDPLDGPFTTNQFTQVHQPIFFDATVWRYGTEPELGIQRVCSSTAWMGVEEADIFGGYDWPARTATGTNGG